VLAPILNKYGIGFRVMHGFNSATQVHDIAEDQDGRILIVLYVGDFDPSGMYMSEEDLPARFEKYEGDHVVIKRIALTRAHSGLPSFPASDKKKDPRYPWFVRNYGKRWPGHGAEIPRPDRSDANRSESRATDHRAGHRLQAVHWRPDHLHGQGTVLAHRPRFFLGHDDIAAST
jgi:hypothetical protein